MNFRKYASIMETPKMKKPTTFFRLSLIACLIFPGLATVKAQNSTDKYPLGIPTDKPGILISPFPPGRKLDVTGLKPGSLAMDPSVEKIFRIPPTTPATKSNVGKKTANYEDYTGKKNADKEPSPPKGSDSPAKKANPESVTGDRPATAPPNMLTSPSITNPPSIPTSGRRMERPRNPGIGNTPTGTGNSTGIRVQPRIASPNDSPPQRNVAPSIGGLPKDLEDFVYAFNETSSNNSPGATLPFFGSRVLYFGKNNQDHNDIIKDRAAYIRKYPYRKYRITARPTVLSAKNGVYELVSPVSYTVQGMGRPISGKVSDYLIVRKTPDSYAIVGIDETKAGAGRPQSIRKAAQRLQSEAASMSQPPLPIADSPAGVDSTAVNPPPVFSGDPEEQVEQLVAAFVKSGESNDPSACLQYVDPEIATYYDLKHPNYAALLKDRSNYIKQWPKRSYTLIDDPEVKEIGDRIYEAVYEISYRVRNSSRTVGGKERSIMQVAETEKGLKIISIFSE